MTSESSLADHAATMASLLQKTKELLNSDGTSTKSKKDPVVELDRRV